VIDRGLLCYDRDEKVEGSHLAGILTLADRMSDDIRA